MIKNTDEEIIAAATSHDTMMQAAASIDVAYNTFIRHAKRLNVYKPNQNQIGKFKGGRTAVPLEEILSGKHPIYQTQKLKKRLIKEGILTEICDICSNGTTWNDMPLVLQLDHIDGNSHNHKRDNLRLLCPNCHTQTPTWGRKNRKAKKVTDAEIIDAFMKTGSVRGVLAELELSKANDNYYRVRDLVVNVNAPVME